MTKTSFGNRIRNEAIRARHRTYQWPLVFALSLFLCLADGCKKTAPAAPAPQPVSVPATRIRSAPTQPAPTFSAAQTIGMFVYPKASQTHDQHLIDESDCYNSVQQRTGINPRLHAHRLRAPLLRIRLSSGEQPRRRGRLRGAVRGAAGGAVIGAIAVVSRPAWMPVGTPSNNCQETWTKNGCE
jgi:hypothetical protein